MSKNLIVIVGPTAVGKTELSIEIARQFDTDILSADSRQCYRELTIGTAKPSGEEQNGVKHHFIDSHSIADNINVGSYETYALKVIEEIFKKKDFLVLTGGTGLYINAVCNGLDDLPEANLELRKKLYFQLEEQGLESLTLQLKELDPEFYQKTDLKNPQRILRALEVSLTTGQPYSSQRTGVKKERHFNIIKIGISREREELYNRINKRVDQMVDQGLLEEVKSLISYKSLNPLQTVGYSELFDFLEGKIKSLEEAINLIKQNTRRYAKRQLTWFRKDKEITWFHPDNKEEIVAYIVQHAKNS